MRMKLELRERKDHPYIWVSPATNTVHLIMPIVSGETISADNTCQTLTAINCFFGSQPLSLVPSALRELTEYKNELEHDIALVDDLALKTQKNERLAQINLYIEMVTLVTDHPQTRTMAYFAGEYPPPIQALLRQPNRNLLSMTLRPSHVDRVRRTIAPTFTVTLDIQTGLFTALQQRFRRIDRIPSIAATTPTQQLVQAVMESVRDARITQPFTDDKIAAISAIIEQKAHIQFSQHIDFKLDRNRVKIDLAYFISLDYLDRDPSRHKASDLKDIIDGFISASGYHLDEHFQIATSLFHVANIATPEGKERLSIITQFFLAQANLYCEAQSFSASVDFGAILDADTALSSEVADCVATSLAREEPVEDALLDFIERHAKNFKITSWYGRTRKFTDVERDEIKQRFNTQYNTIKDSRELDEFMVLEQTRRGPFTSHQGSIGIDFKDLINEMGLIPSDTKAWRSITRDNIGLNAEGLSVLPHQNPHVERCMEITAREVKAKIQGYIKDTRTLNTLAEFLLTNVVTEPAAGPAAAALSMTTQKLFNTLDEPTIAGIRTSPHWGALRTFITAKTTEPLCLDFEHKFSSQNRDIVLTDEMLHALYIHAIRSSEPTEALWNIRHINQAFFENYILPILQRTNPVLEGPSVIKTSPTPPYSLILECPNLAYADAITAIARDNAGFMYVSPAVSRAVYLEANAEFRQGWDTGLNNRGNSPEKLTRALNLLAIPYTAGTVTFPNGGRSKVGYVMRAPLASIQRLQQLSYSRPQFIISRELEGALCTYAVRRASNPHALAGLDGVPKLTEALRIAGFECSEIYPHLDGGSHWAQIPEYSLAENAYQQAFHCIVSTNGQVPLNELPFRLEPRASAWFLAQPVYLALPASDPARTRRSAAPEMPAAAMPFPPQASSTPLETLRNAVLQAINQRVPAGTACPKPGDWSRFDSGVWQYGVPLDSLARSVVSPLYQISINPDETSLVVLNIKAGNAEITDTSKLQRIFLGFMQMINNQPTAEASLGGGAAADPIRHVAPPPIAAEALADVVALRARLRTINEHNKLLDKWRCLCEQVAELSPIQKAQCLLEDYLRASDHPDYNRAILRYISDIVENQITNVPELLMLLQAYKEEQIRNEQWNESSTLARLIQFIETNLQPQAGAGVGRSAGGG